MRATGRSDQAQSGRRRLRASAAASVVAALLLLLSVAAAAQVEPPDSPLVLQQLLGGEVTCVSTEATCTLVNLFGQDGAPSTGPIRPGDQLDTTVQLRNAGTIAASGLDLVAGPCQTEPLSGEVALADLCATITVALDCTAGDATFSLEPQTLTSFGQGVSHSVAAPLAAGASATCQFTITYPADAPPATQELRAVQPATWTLVAPDAPSPTPSDPGGGASPAPAVPPRGPLAFTGADALPLVLAGVALLVAGGVLYRFRRHDRGAARSGLPGA